MPVRIEFVGKAKDPHISDRVPKRASLPVCNEEDIPTRWCRSRRWHRFSDRWSDLIRSAKWSIGGTSATSTESWSFSSGPVSLAPRASNRRLATTRISEPKEAKKLADLAGCHDK